MTPQELSKLLDYDPLTGVFTRKANCGKFAKGSRSGSITTLGYVEVVVSGKRLLGHRLAWAIITGEWPVNQIDHINGNRSDNRLENLREANNAQNQANQGRRKTNKSGFKGVSFDKLTHKWRVDISIRGKSKYVGSFVSIEDASNAAIAARNSHHGQFVNHGN